MRSQCDAPLSPLPPQLTCRNGVQHVSYTLVCDYRSDCSDGSDEDFCHFPECNAERFDSDCDDGKDTNKMNIIEYSEKVTLGYSLFLYFDGRNPPGLINLDGNGGSSFHSIDNADSNTSITCPKSHFLCPSSGYCLPVYLRCNSVFDCPEHEDERDCNTYTCPGYFRCRNSRVCVHREHICDDFEQCPQGEDETLCDFVCPTGCTCYGLSLFCNELFSSNISAHLRFVEAKSSGMTIRDFEGKMLVYLGLAHCDMSVVDMVSCLPNLRSLDLTGNSLTYLNGSNITGHHLPNLRVLSLAGNPLVHPLLSVSENNFTVLETLDLSYIRLSLIDLNDLTLPDTLSTLNLSQSGVLRVTETGFRTVTQLRVLDLTGCPMISFPPHVFRSLHHLRQVRADNFKLCCPDILPVGFSEMNCQAPSDDVSSCRNLLRSNAYRILLTGAACVVLMGNAGSFVYRLLLDKSNAKLGFNVFVTHLCVSDFLMGVYLALIGAADLWFKDTFLWKDDYWKNSPVCSLVGFLSLVSCEVSALIICLITLDRFLVLRFPFSQVRFRPGSAHVTCLVIWAVGLCLGAVPLLPMTSHWQFYSQTGLCMPLPITRQGSATHDYSFAVLIILNFIMCLFIAIGQICVYQSVRSNTLRNVSIRCSNDQNIARRLLSVALSDFLCWFPVGCVGILASQGVSIPGEINVAMAVLVLPLNSAINPTLYTLNIILEKRRLAKEKRLLSFILSQQLDHSQCGDGGTRSE